MQGERWQWKLGPLPGEELYVRGNTVVWSLSGHVRYAGRKIAVGAWTSARRGALCQRQHCCLEPEWSSQVPMQGERWQWKLGPLPGEELYVRGNTVVWSRSGQVRYAGRKIAVGAWTSAWRGLYVRGKTVVWSRSGQVRYVRRVKSLIAGSFYFRGVFFDNYYRGVRSRSMVVSYLERKKAFGAESFV